MKLTQQQINNLITGRQLAAETAASSPELRRFVTIDGYEYDERGHAKALSNTLAYGKTESALFQIWVYEIKKEYIENDWDVTQDDLDSYVYIDDIKGIENAEAELQKHLTDFSLLVTSVNCENPL